MSTEPETNPDLPVTETTVSFQGASDVGQPTDVIYGIRLEPLPPSAHGIHAMPAPDWQHDTMPGFPAISVAAEETPAGPEPEPCRCDEHKYGHVPGAGVVLYCRPGTADLLWALDIRDGRYEDIEGLFDAAWRESRKGFESAARNARLALSIAWHQVEAVAAADRRAA